MIVFVSVCEKLRGKEKVSGRTSLEKNITREKESEKNETERARERECVAEERDSARVRAKIFLGVVSGGACVVRVLPRSKDSKVKLYFRARSKVKQNSFFEHRQK